MGFITYPPCAKCTGRVPEEAQIAWPLCLRHHEAEVQIHVKEIVEAVTQEFKSALKLIDNDAELK